MRLFALFSAVVLSLAAIACSSDSGGGGGVLSGDKAANAPTSAAASSGGGSTAPTTAPAATARPAATTAPSPGALDPCKLLTKEDAAAALGKPVADGKLTVNETNPLGIRLCFYAAASSTDPASVQLSVITSSGISDALKAGRTAKVEYNDQKNIAPATAVPGVGEDAYIRGPSLTFLKGDTLMTVLIAGMNAGSPEHLNAAKAAAGKVLSHLP